MTSKELKKRVKMRYNEINLGFGNLIIEEKETEKDEEIFVGEIRITLELNKEFREKYRCFHINYRGKEHYRLKDEDLEMLFTKNNR